MAQITVGEVDWETVVSGENRGASDFMQLKQGDNRGRVLSNPQQFAVHWVVDETGKKRKVNCAADGCPVCQRAGDGDKPQARWLIKFFNREEGAVKLLEISSQTLNGIKELVMSPDWGAVTEYDINIRRGAPNAKPLYTVIPGRRVPLTADEKAALVGFNERVDLSKFITPPTPEAVAEKLGWAVNAGARAVSNDFRSSGSSSVAKTQTVKKTPNFNFDDE